MRRRSIRTKIMLWAGASLVGTVGLIVAFSTVSLRELAVEGARDNVASHVESRGEHLQAQIAEARQTTATIARTLAAAKQEGSGLRLDRRAVVSLLEGIASEHPEFAGLFCAWEPGAFDGADGARSGLEGQDAAGRFLPLLRRKGEGIERTTLRDLDPAPVWYREALERGEPFVSGLHDEGRDFAGAPVIVVSVPIRHAGKSLGVVGAAVRAEHFDESLCVDDFVGGQGRLSIVDHGARVVGRSGDPEARGETVSLGFEVDESHFQHDGADLVLHQALVIDGAPGPWELRFRFPLKAVNGRASALVTEEIIVGAVATLLALVLIGFFASGLARRVRRAATLLQDVAEGDGDLTARLDVKGRDEIAELGRWFNAFVGHLQEVIARVAQTVASLEGSTGEITRASHSILENTNETSEETRGAASRSGEISQSIETMVASMNELEASIREISSNATRAAQVSGQATEITEASSATINALGKRSEEIGEFVSVISSIAEQTNLLSLNATIEAARAGEAGKGFAVVANEVKELAMESARSSEDIRERIDSVRTEIASAVEGVASIAEVIASVTEISSTIAAAVEEQAVTTGRILENLQEANDSSSQVAESIQDTARLANHSAEVATEASQTADSVATMTRELGSLVSRFRH